MLETLSGMMVNPWLFVAGAAAVALPILIHLLNKRRFQVVDWAAMDFLLDADKKNRRRIRLENLLLLVLRCLAVFLLGLLLARPFIPTGMTAGLIDAAQFERIVLLDDSLSMQARSGNEALWDVARKRVTDLTQTLAAEQSDNSLTLLLTSRPERPLFNAAHLGADTIDETNLEIEKLEPTDMAANLDAALQRLIEQLADSPANVNRVVYIVTDLRSRDWKPEDTNAAAPLGALRRISKLCGGCFVLDVGTPENRNLAVSEVRAERTLVAGVPSRFDVAVTNLGTLAAQDVRVKFGAGDALPLTAEIERIGPGETASVPFSFTFATEEEKSAAAVETGPLAARQVKVELQTARQGEDDRLQADSVVYYPARLVRGIPTLLVDGDPSAAFGKAESFYLRRSLAPTGPVPSGVAVHVATESEFDALSLDKYQVIFLCNVYRLGEKMHENLERLESWVAAGGGLAIFPGDQIDEQFYNEHYFREGKGLSPLKLENIRGDETEATWAQLRVTGANHPLLKIFAGQNNPFLDNVKAFRWWGSSVPPGQLGQNIAIPARLNDADDSPALAEKPLGRGRVLAASIPADADWTNWTSDPSYLIVMQELVRYLSSDRAGAGLLRVGEPIRLPLDLATYDLDVALSGPRGRQANLRAAAPANSPQQSVWQVDYKEADRPGFYEFQLDRREGEPEGILFAANVDPSEGDLKRVDVAAMRRELGDAKVQILSAGAASSLGSLGSQTEIGWYLLWLVAGVLGCEQLLGWFFGRAR